MKIKLLLVVLFLATIPCFSQWNIPYYLYSENGMYFLKCIPHNGQGYEIEGRTDIYSLTDSSFLYSIPRYFNPDNIVLSDDGQSLLYVGFSAINNHDAGQGNMILFFKHGKLEQVYAIDQILSGDDEDDPYGLVYRGRELFEWDHDLHKRVYNDTVREYIKILLEDPLYSHNSVAYFTTRDEELIQISMNSGIILSRGSLWASEKIVNTTHSQALVIKPEYDIPPLYGLPYLADSTGYQEAFAQAFNFAFDEYRNDLFKYYRLEITCLIDSGGNCISAEIDFEDPELNDDIENFFLNVKFDHNAIPGIIEKFYFYHTSRYRNVDVEIALQEGVVEKDEEHEHWLWKIQQDTLDGHYIPKDLDDCMRELDTLLSEKNKEELKLSDPIMAHFGLGLWLRNNWGLWGGSRLERYFASQLGIKHPDSMSGLILDAYHAYLNGKSYNHILEEYKSPLKLKELQVDTINSKY